MALDARVYRNRKNLSFDPETLGATFDEETGTIDFEVEFADEKAADRYIGESIAAEAFIGNVHLVRALREEIGRILPDESMVLSAVLYDGTHSGDWLPVNEIPQLEKELEKLRASLKEKPSARVKQFVETMTKLAAAAKQEGNPILF